MYLFWHVTHSLQGSQSVPINDEIMLIKEPICILGMFLDHVLKTQSDSFISN